MIINIIYALIMGVLFTVLTYIVVAKLRDIEMNIIHIVALGCICLFTGVQSYLFFSAYDEKEALNELTESANSILSIASNYTDSEAMAKDIDKLSKEYKPILDFIGIEVDGSFNPAKISTEALNRYYIEYMCKRVGWCIGVILLYILLCYFLIPKSNNNSSYYGYGDDSYVDTSDWQNY